MLENGTLVDGKYEILSKVGQGGMSVVYLALNRKAMKQWAIKEVRRDGVKDFNVVKQSLVAETDMLKKLSHPNLPDIVDIIDNEDSFLIVMDYIEGKPLSKRIEETGAQPEEYVVEWAKQLCDVLDYLHTRTPSIIYRDMKPSNVMLRPDGSVCLIDFGTAREYKGGNIQDTTCLGTIGYAAPEQFGGQGETDARTDIYCLGATLYHLVTGHSPAEPPYEMHPIRYWDPTLSPGLEAIILKCIQKNPKDRYQSCAELKYALENMEAETYEYYVKQKKHRNLFVACAVATLIFFIMGLTGTLLNHSTIKADYEKYIANSKFAEAFDTGYTGASPQEYSDDLLAYLEHMQNNVYSYQDGELVIAGNGEEALQELTQDELNQFNRAYNEYEEILQRDSNVFCDFCYQVGMRLLTSYRSGEKKGEGESRSLNSVASYEKSSEWFKRTNDLKGLNEAGEREQHLSSLYQTIAAYYTSGSNSEIESAKGYSFTDTFNALVEACDSVKGDDNEIVKFRVYTAYMDFISGTKNRNSIYDMLLKEGTVTVGDITTTMNNVYNEAVLYSGGDNNVEAYASRIIDIYNTLSDTIGAN